MQMMSLNMFKKQDLCKMIYATFPSEIYPSDNLKAIIKV